MIKTGIIGYPLKLTLSPALHNFLFNYFNLNGKYTKIATAPSKLSETIKFIKSEKFRGLNVTIPFKERILEYIDKADGSVQSVDAVNTVLFTDNKLYGFNTDIIGFEKSLDFHGLKVKGKRIALLGTGGAAKACAFVIMNKKPEEFFVVGRKIRKTRLFADKFNAIATDYEQIEKITNNIDILINATPVDFSNLATDMKKGSYYYDLKYEKIPEESEGVNMINGLIMFIYQGIESFRIWTDKRISINKILDSEVFKCSEC